MAAHTTVTTVAEGHVSVLLTETLDALALKPGADVIDGTLGGAGHGVRGFRRSGQRESGP